jgi:pimeloyl-ACP methyl ester carboxylesterase
MHFANFMLVAIAVIVTGVIGFLYWTPKIVTSFILKADRHCSGLLHKKIDLPGGLRYAYLEGGKGEPLMLLHGFGANKDHFTKIARFLTPHYHVIVPDHIGFGESSHPHEEDYSPLAQVERLRAFAHAIGMNRLHLGGSSMGGQIAMTYAASYPAEVKSLWLLAPAGVWSAPKSELFDTIAEMGRNRLMVRSGDEFAQLIAFAMNKPPFIPRFIINVMAQERIRNFALEERIFNQMISDSVETRITDLPTPTLIVWGDKDRVLSFAAAETLHRLISRSQVIIMIGIGHLPMLEQPKQSAEDYQKFRASFRHVG